MKTETILIIILIVLVAAVVAVVMMNQGTGDVEMLQALREEIKEMKKSEIASELEELRSEIKDLQENRVDEPEPVVEDVEDKPDTIVEDVEDKPDTIVEDEEDEVVYLKSAAVVGVQSPDIEKNNFPIESDEIRASAMESQNIVENDAKKNFEKSDAKIAARVMTKGPESMKLSPIFMEKLQSAARKVKEQERVQVINKELEAVGGKVQKAPKAPKGPSPELIRLGPPKMIKPAVCRQIPGSSFDTCGRPTKSVLPINKVLPIESARGKELDKLREQKERRTREMKARAEGMRKTFGNWSFHMSHHKPTVV